MRNSILFLLFFFPLFGNAQFNDYYNYYIYIARGETPQSCTSGIYYAHFDEDEKLYCSTVLESTLKSKYNDDVIEEYAINKNHNYRYDSNMSTYKYEVYVEKNYTQHTLWGTNLPAFDPYTGMPSTYHSGYRYCAFSMDRSEMIIWTTTKDDNTPREKKYYKRVKIEDLVPPSDPSKYDFLR